MYTDLLTMHSRVEVISHTPAEQLETITAVSGTFQRFCRLESLKSRIYRQTISPRTIIRLTQKNYSGILVFSEASV